MTKVRTSKSLTRNHLRSLKKNVENFQKFVSPKKKYLEKYFRNLLRIFTSSQNILYKPIYNKSTRIDGKITLITGANTGIGKENALDFAKRGATVYMACRDIHKGSHAAKEVKEKSGNKNIHLMELNLASIQSILRFSENFSSCETNLHILVNNAGIMACPKSFTSDGFEMQIGTNHLGHFLLTLLLIPTLKSSAPSRIVNVSSTGHRMSDLNRSDLMSEKSYNKIKAYAQSKLANVLFTQELARRLHGTGVTVNSCHPGVVQTELGRHVIKFKWIKPIYKKICAPIFKTPFEGAQTQIKLAVDPELELITGKYFSDCDIDEPSAAAKSQDNAHWLWDESIKLLSEKLDDKNRIKITNLFDT